MAAKNSQTRKEKRRTLAAEMAEERAKRTPQEQLERLDGLFGKGQGAVKERARLAKLIEAESLARIRAENSETEKKTKADKPAAKPKGKKKGG